VIRPLPISELDRTAACAREFYATSGHLENFRPERFRETWTALIGSGMGVIFADERDGEITGVIGGICHRDPNSDDMVAAEMFWFVREQFRGVGIALYREFEKWAESKCAASIQMVHMADVMPEKVKAFYLREGYELAETRYVKKLVNSSAFEVRIEILDDALDDPETYRAEALTKSFRSFEFERCTFHGIAPVANDSVIPELIKSLFPAARPSLSFFRRSPEGQEEPHFIHTDADMGEWSSILYLNPNPPEGDGTTFWKHRATGTIGSGIPHERSKEGTIIGAWEPWERVGAKFNRLILFKSTMFHSRAIPENWGSGDNARLTQVTFGRWAA